MQNYTPRPSLQSAPRPSGSATLSYGRNSVQVPPRGYGTAVDRAMTHNFADSHPLPSSYGHFSDTAQAKQPQTPTYASSTQAMFAAPEPPHQTPYQQMYHYDPLKQERVYHFPFRALMVILVIGAISFGAFAVYKAFTNPSPVNAELESNDVFTP